MRDLDLVVLADRNSSVCRAYLAYLASGGFRPKKLLLVDFLGKATKTEALSSVLGRRFTAQLQRWYRARIKFRKVEAPAWQSIATAMDTEFQCSVPLFDDFSYSQYAEDVKAVVVNGFDDPVLLKAVIESDSKVFLYTGGGLIGRALLEMHGVRVIHIHPGIVPDVRGADGILWSTLIRGKLGYSGFYMNPGIDTGDIMIRREYELPQFDKQKFHPEWTFEDLYKALLFSYDAHLRASTLLELVGFAQRNGYALDQLPSERQTESEGRTYFFMHPKLRNVALGKMLK